MDQSKPKILVLDIETSPILASIWRLWKQVIAPNQIERDWFVISWAAKWADSDKVMYKDQRNAKNIEDDKELLEDIWKLMDEADILVTQNGKSFDEKKLKARFIINGMKPYSPCRHIDTKIIANKFGFTSSGLEYLTDKLCRKYKKLKHKKYPGLELWQECIKGNLDAWEEMEKYNKHDVLSLDELYRILLPWEETINMNVYNDCADTVVCSCGSKSFKRDGYAYSNGGRYQRYRCYNCGALCRGKRNLINSEKKASLLVVGGK